MFKLSSLHELINSEEKFNCKALKSFCMSFLSFRQSSMTTLDVER
jgi:hypothetical protein